MTGIVSDLRGDGAPHRYAGMTSVATVPSRLEK